MTNVSNEKQAPTVFGMGVRRRTFLFCIAAAARKMFHPVLLSKTTLNTLHCPRTRSRPRPMRLFMPLFLPSSADLNRYSFCRSSVCCCLRRSASRFLFFGSCLRAGLGPTHRRNQFDPILLAVLLIVIAAIQGVRD